MYEVWLLIKMSLEYVFYLLDILLWILGSYTQVLWIVYTDTFANLHWLLVYLSFLSYLLISTNKNICVYDLREQEETRVQSLYKIE